MYQDRFVSDPLYQVAVPATGPACLQNLEGLAMRVVAAIDRGYGEAVLRCPRLGAMSALPRLSIGLPPLTARGDFRGSVPPMPAHGWTPDDSVANPDVRRCRCDGY